MSELLVNTIKKADGTGSLTVPAESGTVVTTASPSLGRRNLIINGAMQVAQRGTSAVSANSSFPVDRFILGVTTASKFTAQQSSEAPIGFSTSLLLTSSSAYTPASGDSLIFAQRIEGYNVAQLESGTANAQTMTLSFYVRSSLTGTFAGFFANGDYNRTYPFTYTISSADTWERKTITLTADTAGTWGATNGRGISVHWSLGIGSTLQGTANTWQAGNYQGVSGAVDLVATNGATLYITGVQLEVGDTATPFEHRSYGEELALCQRYFIQTEFYGTSTSKRTFTQSTGSMTGTNNWLLLGIQLPTEMRAIPSLDFSDLAGNTGKLSLWANTAGGLTDNISSHTNYIEKQAFVVSDYFNNKMGIVLGGYKVDAEL